MEKSLWIEAQYAEMLEAQRNTAETKKFKITMVRRYIRYLTDRHQIGVLDATQKEVFAWLQSRNHLKPRSYNQELAILKEFWRYLGAHYGYRLDTSVMKNKLIQTILPRNIPLDRLNVLCTPAANESQSRLTVLRDQAIIEFLISTGVRSVELRYIQLGHLSADLSECMIVTAKGGKNRLVYLGKPAREAVDAYLALREPDYGRHTRDWLFISRTGKQLDSSAVTRVVKRVARHRLGYVVTPHMCRHTFGTEMLRATGCLRSVQIMMGHVRLRNTTIYCALDFSDHYEAMRRFHPHGGSFITPDIRALDLDSEEQEW